MSGPARAVGALRIVASGPLATLQDEGRRGLGAIGVGRSGAADLPAYRAANRLVGNTPGVACLEITNGGLIARALGRLLLAVTGPRTSVRVNGHPVGDHVLLELRDGDTLAVSAPGAGLRNYVAIRGGILGVPVLGSLSTDSLSGLGPDSLVPGDLLQVGTSQADWPAADHIPTPAASHGHTELPISPGPRADWFTPDALATLVGQAWSVTAEANRVGIRLAGARPLERSITRELQSEGISTGAVQVPAGGQPVLFLVDHPVTGGYPVIAVVRADALAAAAQLRPGDSIRFRPTR